MDHFRIRPISEPDIDAIIEAAGGSRAHNDPGRQKRGADYRLGEAVIELKALDDEGFDKPERQAKLAALFGRYADDWPVVVLDPARLPPSEMRAYTNIVEGPILGAARSAKGQLVQSRIEHADAELSILMLVNNGYTALNNDQICELAARRVRQYPEIDGIIVGGCYSYGDGFDSYFLWPLEYVPTNLGKPFPSFERLREAWNGHAGAVMTELMTTMPGQDATKGPVVDVRFDVDGRTYVKPAPLMGEPSKFYGSKRPRENSTGLTVSPPVAIVFPDLSQAEWALFHDVVDGSWELGANFGEWKTKRREALESGTALKPLVPMPLKFEEWRAAIEAKDVAPTMQSVRRYATDEFHVAIRRLLEQVRERSPDRLLPSRYILAFTQEIGQDKANDVSAILSVRERVGDEPIVQVLADKLRIFHEHAIVLAAAYAVREGVGAVLWEKDLEYAWT